MQIKVIKEKEELEGEISKEKIIEFFHEHLDQFRDKKSAISNAIDYALSKDKGKGGFILIYLEENKIIASVLMNYTGMKEYIPEYFLVYVAVHKEYRGRGIGGNIIKKAIELSDGDVALHVEYNNPALRLYKRIGFTNKYAEMRFIKDK